MPGPEPNFPFFPDGGLAGFQRFPAVFQGRDVPPAATGAYGPEAALERIEGQSISRFRGPGRPGRKRSVAKGAGIQLKEECYRVS